MREKLATSGRNPAQIYCFCFLYISAECSLASDWVARFACNRRFLFESRASGGQVPTIKMGGKTKGKNPTDTRKPKHSNDQGRSNAKAKDGMRDAATVRFVILSLDSGCYCQLSCIFTCLLSFFQSTNCLDFYLSLQVRRLAMYNNKAKRDRKGRIISHDFQSKDLPTTRIQPDRRWFGNTRVIGQKQLEAFREEMAGKVNDPYTVLLKEKKLPLSLLEDPEAELKRGGKLAKASLVATQPFSSTFGKKKTRKKPKLATDSYADLVANAEAGHEQFIEKKSALVDEDDARAAVREPVFEKGQSKRIWGELYKVIDSSDVVLQVLDARDPMGTRCRHLETHLRKNARHKHMIFLLNKCDLVSRKNANSKLIFIQRLCGIIRFFLD